jgi:tetratricopeptide (TPR) repeat protein
MVIEDDFQVKLKRQMAENAIALAMAGKWQEAITVNQEIVVKFPDDVEAYNRLGRAYMELGKYSLSRDAYGKAITLDPANTIARKTMMSLSILEDEGGKAEETPGGIEPYKFIEETGKTVIVELGELAPANVLARVSAGEKVNLSVNGHNLQATDIRGAYLGIVGEAYARRLVKLIKGGNRYSAAIISHSPARVMIIIREEYRDPSQSGYASFPVQNIKAPKPYVSKEAFRGDLDYEDLMSEEASENTEESGGVEE